MSKIKEILKNKFVRIFIGIILILIFNELSKPYFQSKKIEHEMNSINKRFDEIKENTKPNESVMENASKQFQKEAKELLDSKKDEKSKSVTAANVINGAYISNVRTRYDYCKDQGVDISEFVKKYKSRNALIMRDVKKILETHFKEKNFRVEEEQLYLKMKPTAYKMITQDMLEISKVWKITDMAKVCSNLNTFADQITDSIALTKVLPEYSKIVTQRALEIN